ncbi:hypothetical protein NQ318_002812 [Aromia moschata]|uniref:Transposase n=1 Tax=Aromia moschata TaxID=1265417 RepID=A0AAV8XQ95_9CUCU|nr:hypothetical protein NQ318_002812 [Aromia moschata]
MNHMIVVLEPPSRKTTYVEYVSFWRKTVALHLKKLLDQWESVIGVCIQYSTTNLISGRSQLDGFLDFTPPINKSQNAAYRTKRRHSPIINVVFFHDNARPHTAAITQAKLEEMHLWEQLEHPPLQSRLIVKSPMHSHKELDSQSLDVEQINFRQMFAPAFNTFFIPSIIPIDTIVTS